MTVLVLRRSLGRARCGDPGEVGRLVATWMGGLTGELRPGDSHGVREELRGREYIV